MAMCRLRTAECGNGTYHYLLAFTYLHFREAGCHWQLDNYGGENKHDCVKYEFRIKFARAVS